MRLIAGIDCGSGYTKAVLLEAAEGEVRVLGKGRVRTGVHLEEAAKTALAQALEQAGAKREDVAYVATTGFGRYSIPFRDIQVTEITSAARGAYHLFPESECVLDIGGQSTRAVGLRDAGKVKAFKTNDKCAAGSGMFLARAAKYLGIEVEQIGELSMSAQNPQPISSICAVLAESEIINHVSAGVSVEDILRGIHDSLAERAGALLKRVGMQKELTLIGGVARQRGMVKALEERLQVRVQVPEDCDSVCALGAALLGRVRLAASANVMAGQLDSRSPSRTPVAAV
ncbi:MAG: acyl-CoA dehydratase activase [Acidobacteriota bacterium]|nr:acyl-CoA dehydratase activase [Acidobacteriota bacterium]